MATVCLFRQRRDPPCCIHKGCAHKAAAFTARYPRKFSHVKKISASANPASRNILGFLTSEHDLNCSPRLNKMIAAALPNAELVVLNGLRHGLVIEAPDQVAREIERFLGTFGIGN
jgi:pimeloyl-ACP methyl ester carboxylesterase